MLRRERSAGTLWIGLAAVAVLLRSLISLARSIFGGEPITPYVAPQYWLSYHHGFVRRGLPGQLLQWASGGHAPSRAIVDVVGVTLSVAAVLAVTALALLLARSASDRLGRFWVVAAVVSSPLTLSLYLRDLGRVDAVGVVILVLLVTLPWRRWPPALVVGGLAVLTSVAVATSEFLVVLLVPVAVVVATSSLTHRPDRTDRPGMSRDRALLWGAVAVLPCLLLAGLSAALPAPAVTLTEASNAARAAGVPASVPLTPQLVDHDSVSRLRYGLLDNIRDYYATTTPARVVGTTLLWGGLFAGLVSLVWLQLGRSLRDRALHVLLVLFASAAVALSVAAIDYRRWWSLATVAALALMLELTRSCLAPSVVTPQYASSGPAVPDATGQDQTGRDQTVPAQTVPAQTVPAQTVPDRTAAVPRPGRARTVVLIVLVLAGVVLQSTPVWPLQLADLPLLGALLG